MPETTTRWSGFADYAPEGRALDEMVAARGAIHPHGAGLVGALEALGPAEMSARLEAARRTIRDHDVTYNVYDDPLGMDRPWQLDIVPHVIAPAAWSRLEAGLAQRARLLDLVLADLYDGQRLVRDRLLPSALVYANPGFLRPCHGLPVAGGRFLHLHAVDLARTPDGAWWVLADRTQAPSGAGYALENRIVLSRSLPEAFRDCRVQRLAPFFRALREMLHALAPRPSEAPRVVLLTSGPFNETYFEHAYLARYLGLTLVEGGDLTVRDEGVFLKTVEGLQPVDVILRRMDDGFCDPLELRGDSSLGVAGLVQAVRAGRVAVANALGSGVLETPAMLPFLPGLCRHLLGEELTLPSVPTWWCGQPLERDHVIAHLDDMVIKPAYSRIRREPAFGACLSRHERAALIAEIRQRPGEFVGQMALALSTAPVWADGRLTPRSIVVRAFAAAEAGGEGYAVMPGGLTRVADATASSVVSTQSGGGSKDTWILSDGPVAPVSLLAPAGTPVAVDRAPKDLSSRVADNLFWLGRYAERCESLVRVFRAATSRLVEAASIDDAPELAAMVRAMATLELVPKDAPASVSIADLEAQTLDAMLDEHRPSGLRQTLGQLRHVAWLLRDRLSGDAWRILNQLHQDLRGDVDCDRAGDALVLLNRIVLTLAAFSGVEAENMTRGHGWRFLSAGRRLERGATLATVIRAMLPAGGSDSAALWPLLEIGDSSMTYRRRYYAEASLAPVLDLLVADDSVPRSLAFQLQALAAHIDGLPRDPGAPASTREQALAARLLAAIRGADVTALCAARTAGRPEPLDRLLKETARGLGELSDTLSHYYFSHAVSRVS
ncbi:MAG: circularly permuted type 2 ATP-grasp protein [Vicinamibacteraceae bacterium]